jgi:hypothetical protein
VLVRPAEYPALEAEQRAVSAVDVLERARVHGGRDSRSGFAGLRCAAEGRFANPRPSGSKPERTSRKSK